MMLCFAFFGVARADVVEIGDGTAQVRFPINMFYNYSLSQQIYTADEIGTAGTITSIAFQYAYTSAYDNTGVQVYMKNVDKETFTSTTDMVAVSSGDLVFEGTFSVPAEQGGWATIELDSPFAYDGTSNLLVCMYDPTNGYAGSSYYFYGTATEDNKTIFYYSDSYVPDLSNVNSYSGNKYTYAQRVNTQITITSSGGPVCEKPSTFEVSNITGSSADFAWTSEVGNYTFEYKKASDNTWTVVSGLTTTSYTLSNLESMTAYNARVKAVCGTDFESGYKTANFTTKEVCPDGKICIGEGTATNSYLPTYILYNYSLTEQIYTAAEIGTAGAILSVDIYSVGSATRTLEVYMVSTTKSAFADGSDWIAATASDLLFNGSVTFAANSWNTIEFDNPFIYDGTSNVALIVRDMTGSWVSSINYYVFSAPSQAIYIYRDASAYDLSNPGTGTLLSVKNRVRLTIGVPPTCPKPTGLTVSNVTNHTADLSWTSDASAWQICVDGDEDNLIDVTTNSYTLTGLAAEAHHTVQVRANCGAEDGVSDWAEATFTTLVACPAPTGLTVVATPISANVSWTSDNDNFELWWREKANTPNNNFEDGTLGNWTNIDADGDGYIWYVLQNSTIDNDIPGHNGSDGLATSASYQGAALTPDNYLVSPKITLGGSISFWACGQDASWAGEHFGVAVSTTGNTNAADFTTIAEWDMTAKGIGAKTNETRSGNRDQGAWYQYTVDLSAYSGQGYVAIRHFDVTDMFRLNVDDIEIVQPGVVEPEWNVVNPATNPYIITGLTESTEYEVQVRSICGGEDGESVWTYTTFETPSACDAPTDLNVPHATLMPTSATLEWTGYQNSYNVWYRPFSPGSELESIDFEDGTMGNWTTIDADGDGNEWILGSSFGITTGHDGSTDFILSQSYDNTNGVLYPDNYLVSPQVTLGGSITFWACAQDASWPAEHFGVAVSTTGNTDAADFTTIKEWTMTSKGIGAKTNMTRSGNRDQGVWYQFTADLSAYSGQGYVAIRHFNSSDNYFIDVDDISINAPGGGEWIQLTANENYKDIENLSPETTYEWMVQGINPNCDGEATAWSEISTFTTPGYCDKPIDLNAEVDGTTVTLSWTGYQDSFDVTYYTAALGNVLIETGVQFYDDGTSWTPVTNDEEESGFYCLDNDCEYVGYWFASMTSPQYLISPEFTPLEGTSILEFMYATTGTDDDEDLPETFKIGYSTTDNDITSFTWADEWESVSGVDYYMTTLPEGAKYFAIQYSSDHTEESYLVVLDFFLVTNYVPAGEPVTLSGVTSPQTITGLEEETVYFWTVQGISDDCDVPLVKDNFITGVQTMITQTLDLASGDNWVSFYVETNMDDLKAALVEALGNSRIVISSLNSGQATWNGRLWVGQLRALDLSQMYKINVASSCEITLEAMPIDPATLTINIVNGINWIGFPFSESMTVANAFSGFAYRNDVVKSQSNGQATWNSRIWTGQLKNLEPGKGYIYISADPDTPKPFTYTSSKATRNSNVILRERKQDLSTLSISKVSKK